MKAKTKLKRVPRASARNPGFTAEVYQQVAVARNFKSELWQKIAERVDPDVKKMLYAYGELDILCSSLLPEINHLELPQAYQFGELCRANCDAAELLKRQTPGAGA